MRESNAIRGNQRHIAILSFHVDNIFFNKLTLFLFFNQILIFNSIIFSQLYNKFSVI